MTALRQSIEAEAKQTPTKPKAAAPKGKAAPRATPAKVVPEKREQKPARKKAG
jgi:hypothetical protein